MNTEQQYRQLMAELGIDDDRQERALIDMFQAKDTDLELERARVPDQVWELEEQLLKERTR